VKDLRCWENEVVGEVIVGVVELHMVFARADAEHGSREME
jgi:hypothetical protein